MRGSRGCAMTWCAQRDWEWGLDGYYTLSNHGTQSNSYIHVNEKHYNAIGEYDIFGLLRETVS